MGEHSFSFEELKIGVGYVEGSFFFSNTHVWAKSHRYKLVNLYASKVHEPFMGRRVLELPNLKVSPA